MSAIASQITGVSIVYSTVCSGIDQRKHRQSSASLAFVRGNSPVTGEFPAQMASNAENASSWWRHHAGEEVAGMLCNMFIVVLSQLNHQGYIHLHAKPRDILYLLKIHISVYLPIYADW